MAARNSRQVQRHPSIYFNDGDVILAAATHTARNTVQVFRVSKYLLSRNSHFFRAMFSLPQPRLIGLEDEKYDGVPVVPMQDAAEDLAVLLDVLHNPL